MAAMAGLDLDPWQQLVLRESLGERADGKWAAFEVGVVVPRQNGKGGILEGRELAGLFLLGEPLIIHSAHQFDTSLEAFRRLLALIEDTPEFDRRVQRIQRSHGEEGVELKNGQRIRFRTRTKGGGRGFSCDCLILDEAMILPKAAHGALLPTLAARRDKTESGAQVWYTGSAVDEEVHEHGVVLARVRERALEGDDPALAYFEWSVDADEFLENPKVVARDPAAWATANPGLGIRIYPDHIAKEQRSLDPRTFAVERLGVGFWPATDDDQDQLIDREAWMSCEDSESEAASQVAFAIEATPDRGKASIALAGVRSDKLGHAEVIKNDRETGWVVPACVALQEEHRKAQFVVDPRGPAGSLIEDLVANGVAVAEINTAELVRACGSLFDDIRDAKFRYPQNDALDLAVASATVRPLGDAWAWDRKNKVDMSSLVAVTLALWGAKQHRAAPKATYY